MIQDIDTSIGEFNVSDEDYLSYGVLPFEKQIGCSIYTL